jgi:anaerobic magnesium-protoporphyrin IX monomethyl ester cyclase
MKILFSHSYFLRFDPKQWQTGQPYPPLGTLYAAAVLRAEGHAVSLFDAMFVKTPHAVARKIDDECPDLFVIYDDGFNYLTKMCLTNMREAAFEMIRIAKEKGCKVVVSSSDSTDHYEQYLEMGADYILLGEAEMTLVELTRAIENNDEETVFGSIDGVAFHYNGALVKTPRRSVMKDLDSLPMPAWDLVDIEQYRSCWMKSSGYFSINMGTTRGCPYKCNWCAKPIYGNRYNSRSPENVVRELVFLNQRFGLDHVWFCDDIFGLKPGWVKEFAELVKKERLRIRFKIQSRADLLLQEDHIRALAEAGCENVWMGAESGSQKILDSMDKGITTEQIKEATAVLKKCGIRPSFFIQFGYPGETKEDIQETIQMINNLLPSSIGVSVSYPLPGTVFYERVKVDFQGKSNWTDSDELQLMFKNTYQPAFYKQLHRYVQKNHRKHLAVDFVRRVVRNPLSLSLSTVRKAISLIYYVPAVVLAKLKLTALEKAA